MTVRLQVASSTCPAVDARRRCREAEQHQIPAEEISSVGSIINFTEHSEEELKSALGLPHPAPHTDGVAANQLPVEVAGKLDRQAPTARGRSLDS
jgi:hypothetical protein